LGHAATFGQKGECEVVGQVTDLQGGLDMNSKVRYRSMNGEEVGTNISDRDGRYSIKLRDGTFEVSVNLGAYPGRYKRANITIACQSKTLVNLYLLPECVSFGCNRLGFDFVTYGPKWTKDPVRNMSIAFSKRKKVGTTVIFEVAVLTYDFYTIKGERIVQDLSTGKILIQGPAWLDDGKNNRDIESLVVSFTDKGIRLGHQ